MNYFEHKKILVPHDFSKFSDSAVETAIEIAGNCRNVTVLHAVAPATIYGYTIGDGDFGPMEMRMPNIESAEEIDATHQQRALKTLKGQFADAHHVGLNFATTVDDAPYGIADFALENKFDLIVMPSHGRTGIKRWLIGSVTESVVRLAHCPVLVLRS